MNGLVGDLPRLRVKSKSLAVESRIIRHEERRTDLCIRCGKWKRNHIEERRQGQGPKADFQLVYLVCEEGGKGFKGRRPRGYYNLQGHRVYQVRREARATHLARMFLHGRHYSEVEQFARTQPNWRVVSRLVAMYCPREILEAGDYARWRQAASDKIRDRQLAVRGSTP